MKRTLRAGPFVFRDPVLLCGVLYGLLWFDASGFLRIGLWAAFLHECGHVAAYLAMLHEMPTLEVNMTGFCMRTRGKALMPQQTFWLAALCCQPFFCPFSPLISHEPAKCGMLTPKFAAA